MNVDGSGKKQLTTTSHSEFSPIWTPDSKKILFLYAEGDNPEVYSISPDGSGRTQLTTWNKAITNMLISPDGNKLMVTIDTKVDKSTSDIYPDLNKSDGKIITDLMYRHWDGWEDGSYQHVCFADYNNGKPSETTDIMPNEPWDSPLAPFGDVSEITWSPDSKTIAYTCKKLKGKAYTFSTNSDIYLYNIDTKETKNISEGMPGYDRAPIYSPDGKKIYWLSMARGGFEADRERLFYMDPRNGRKKRSSSQLRL